MPRFHMFSHHIHWMGLSNMYHPELCDWCRCCSFEHKSQFYGHEACCITTGFQAQTSMMHSKRDVESCWHAQNKTTPPCPYSRNPHTYQLMGSFALFSSPGTPQHRNHQTRTGSTHPPRSKRRQVKATGFGRLQGLQPLEALEAIHQAA